MKKGGLFFIGMLVVVLGCGLVFTGCPTGGDDGGGGDSLSTSWSESQWQNWFDTHSPTDESALSDLATFITANGTWIAQHSWWGTMYSNWSTGGGDGGTGTGGDYDGGSYEFSTTWTESQWASWFNSHPYNINYGAEISIFAASNTVWRLNNPWWSFMYNDWMNGKKV
ncbi:MAG: hypothetical protein LBK83_05025 [Treponema sp.]|jgi:hypothetical protein|nr:hypothetical protein [Treponema sp.]